MPELGIEGVPIEGSTDRDSRPRGWRGRSEFRDAFVYDVDGLGYSDDLVRLGTTTDLDRIKDLDGQRVTVQVD